MLVIQSIPAESKDLRYFSLHSLVRPAILPQPFIKIIRPFGVLPPFTFQNDCIASDMEISQVFAGVG